MRESSRLSTPVDLSKRRSVIRTSLASSSRLAILNVSTFFWENEHLVIFRTSDASSPTSSVRQESAERVCSVQVRFSLSVSSGVRRWISSIYSISSNQCCGDIIEKAHKIKEFHVLRFIGCTWLVFYYGNSREGLICICISSSSSRVLAAQVLFIWILWQNYQKSKQKAQYRWIIITNII